MVFRCKSKMAPKTKTKTWNVAPGEVFSSDKVGSVFGRRKAHALEGPPDFPDLPGVQPMAGLVWGNGWPDRGEKRSTPADAKCGGQAKAEDPSPMGYGDPMGEKNWMQTNPKGQPLDRCRGVAA